jgi:hypothetical protein
MTNTAPCPFDLSLSKGWLLARRTRSWFDRLTTNGRALVDHTSDSR